MRGLYQEALQAVHSFLDQLNSRHRFVKKAEDNSTPEASEELTYLFYKLNYLKARLFKKMRHLSDADTVCHFLVQCTQTASESAGQDEQLVKPWWKYGVKAVYMLSAMLGSYTEFARPKALM
jgi:hypothetical protein